VRYLLVTCIVFLLLWFVGYDGFGDKFTEGVIGIIAFFITAVILFIWDLCLAPSRMHFEQGAQIKALEDEIGPYKAREAVLSYMIANANKLRNMQSRVWSKELSPDEYMERATEIYNDLKDTFSKSPHGQFFDYRMSDVGYNNPSLAPVTIDIFTRDLKKKLGVEDELARSVATYFAYRNNLDNIISSLSNFGS